MAVQPLRQSTMLAYRAAVQRFLADVQQVVHAAVADGEVGNGASLSLNVAAPENTTWNVPDIPSEPPPA